ncbi:hypothetical protein L7F22_066875 [Adiantum nelumboides]|nr:hypothetical protein [Adiantum nelumboides]
MLFLRLLLLLLVFYKFSSTYNGGGQKQQLQPQLNSFLPLAHAASLSNATALFRNYCSSETFSETSYSYRIPYDTNIVALKSDLTTSSASHRFFSIVTGTEQYVYGMYKCLSYLTLSQCFSCVDTATDFATKLCPQSFAARIELEGCSFLYQNTSITYSSSSLVIGTFISGSRNNGATFLASRTAVLQNVSTSAPYAPNRYSSVNLDDTIYAVAQCNEDLTQDECLDCLADAPSTERFGLGNDTGVRIILESCFFRYECNPFYNDEEVPHQFLTFIQPIDGELRQFSPLRPGLRRCRPKLKEPTTVCRLRWELAWPWDALSSWVYNVLSDLLYPSKAKASK